MENAESKRASDRNAAIIRRQIVESILVLVGILFASIAIVFTIPNWLDLIPEGPNQNALPSNLIKGQSHGSETQQSLRSATSAEQNPKYVDAGSANAIFSELSRLNHTVRQSHLTMLTLVAFMVASLVYSLMQLGKILKNHNKNTAESQIEERLLSTIDSVSRSQDDRYFYMQIALAKARSSRTQQGFAVMLMSFEKSQKENSSRRETGGEDILETVRQRLLFTVRKSEALASLEGTYIAMVLDLTNDHGEPIVAASRLANCAQNPTTLETTLVQISPSVGIAFFPSDGTEPDQLVQSARTALHFAQQETSGSIRFFEESMNECAARELERAVEKTTRTDLRTCEQSS